MAFIDHAILVILNLAILTDSPNRPNIPVIRYELLGRGGYARVNTVTFNEASCLGFLTFAPYFFIYIAASAFLVVDRYLPA